MNGVALYPEITEKDINRFWLKVDKSALCWLWLASLDKDGYGKFGLGGRKGITGRAHVVSWIINYGTVPNSLCVLHSCDTRSCVNPTHLFLGTKRDNTVDMINKGRRKNSFAPGEKHPYAKLTLADVNTIKVLKKKGHTNKALAKQFGVTSTNISCIIHGKIWKTASEL